MTRETSRGAIAAPHSLATAAGEAAICAGGNAIDAALAAAATLCVVYPNQVALGGDLVALVRSPDGRVRFLNATGPAARAESLANLADRHGTRLPLRHIDCVTLPGAVRGWQALHRCGATRPWAAHLADATRHARDGVPVARSVARALRENRASLRQDPGARAVFFHRGEPLSRGDTLRQPALAATLARLAAHGADDFYAGELATAWLPALRALGSRLTADEVAGFRPEWADSLAAEVGGLRIHTSPPNTSGFMLLRALRTVRALHGVQDLRAGSGAPDPLASGAGELCHALWDANRVREAWLADPRFGGATGEELITRPAPPAGLPGGGKPTGDTIAVSAATADGWAVSLIQSLYWGFGAHVLDPATGVLFHNRGTSFSLDPRHPAAFAPGARPRHTLMPVIVCAGDAVRWVAATMGGSAQPHIHAQLLLRLCAGAEPAAAIAAPRWIVDEWGGSGPVAVTAERDVDPTALAAIRAAGFAVRCVPPHSEDLGHANVVQVDRGGFAAASDPRSDGAAAVVG